MAFRRIRTIKGRRYLYEEVRYRVGKKVRSKSKCLGRIDCVRSIFGGVPHDARGMKVIEQMLTEDSNRIREKNARLEAAKDKLSKELGVTFPKENESIASIDKPTMTAATEEESTQNVAVGEQGNGEASPSSS